MKTFIFVLLDWTEIRIEVDPAVNNSWGVSAAELALLEYMKQTGQFSRWRALESFLNCFEYVGNGLEEMEQDLQLTH